MTKKITELGQDLSRREERFVDEYLFDFNGTQAVIRSGYQVKNENVAHVIASRLLQKDTIIKRIEKNQKDLAVKHRLSRDYFVVNLRALIEDHKTKTTDRIKALALLARITGHLATTQDTTQQTVIIQQIGMP
jgi:phage terminase small subunit